MTRSHALRLAAALLFIFGGCFSSSAASFEVERKSVADRKIVFATVESTDVTTARARIGGTLQGLVVDEGDRIERGQRIAVVVDEKLPQQLAALDARIEALTARVDLAAVDLERIQALRARDTVSQARLDEAPGEFRCAGERACRCPGRPRGGASAAKRGRGLGAGDWTCARRPGDRRHGGHARRGDCDTSSRGPMCFVCNCPNAMRALSSQATRSWWGEVV